VPTLWMADLKLVSRDDFLQRSQTQHRRLLFRVDAPQSAESGSWHRSAAADGDQLLVTAKAHCSLGGDHVEAGVHRVQSGKRELRILNVIRVGDAIFQTPPVGLPMHGQNLVW